MIYFDLLFTLIAAAAYTDAHHMFLNFFKFYLFKYDTYA